MAPTDGWYIGAGVAWLDTGLTEWDAVDREDSAWPNTVYYDASGVELAQSPEWSMSATVSYEWSLTEGMMMSLAGDASYKDDTSGLIRPENATEDYYPPRHSRAATARGYA